jgi:hypothetical protein
LEKDMTKKKSRYFLFGAAICALGFLQCVRADLVPNSSFETLNDGKVLSWEIDNPRGPVTAQGGQTSAGTFYSLVPGVKSNGSKALRIGSKGHVGGDYTLARSARFKLLPGYSYELSFLYRSSGLLAESADRARITSAVLDLDLLGTLGRTGGERLVTQNNSSSWSHLAKSFKVTEGTQSGQLRVQLSNRFDQNPAWVEWDDISVVPLDPTLPNGSVEAGDADTPQSWASIGAAKTAWTRADVRTGNHSLSVADAPDGQFSGWSLEIPVRSDRSYSFVGNIKGTDLNANGFIAGGALQLQFLDASGQPLGKPLTSPAVGSKTDWTAVATPKTVAPPDAVSARLTAGMQYTNGTAYFDDLSIRLDEVAMRSQVRLMRHSQRDAMVRYATNLLANGDVEAGSNGKPNNWTYLGKSATDWTPEELQRLQSDGRPFFEAGRGQGEWIKDGSYSGRGALLNVSIDPPVTPNKQWYGRNPVNGYWLSDPMPASPGQAYLSAAWIKAGQPINGAWIGPLEIRFYDGTGRQLKMAEPASLVRPGIGQVPSGVWSFYATQPYTAPAGTTNMRLRFGQEYRTDAGGWGRTLADNLAVWALPAGVPLPDYKTSYANTPRFQDWFTLATAQLKAPYSPAPTDASQYENIWGNFKNSVPGNLYFDPIQPVEGRIALTNLLGESRRVSLTATRYDWLGNAEKPFLLPPVTLGGGSSTTTEIALPPTRKFGAFYLDIEVKEGGAVVGNIAGRYAVMPPRNRKRSTENIWGVTPLSTITGNGSAYEAELGQMMKNAGFGIAWVRFQNYPLDEAKLVQALVPTKKIVAYYHSLGFRVVLNLMPNMTRPISLQALQNAGRIIGREMGSSVAAFGNHGIEQANSKSPYRGSGALRATDDEFDTIMAAQYEGLKTGSPNTLVLTGNIATDIEANTLRRLYAPPGNGKFDGAILNAYLGLGTVVQKALQEFDAHGDTQKTVWVEENSDQRSPFDGAGRRFGEAEGPKNMVRSWLGVLGSNPKRVKALTMWGFVNNIEEDINMVTPRLQPRPQYVAFSVMTDALADASRRTDHSNVDSVIFEWKRPRDTLFTVWANAGERTLAFKAPSGQITVMDLMGNCRTQKAAQGKVTLKISSVPQYVFGTNVSLNN